MISIEKRRVHSIARLEVHTIAREVHTSARVKIINISKNIDLFGLKPLKSERGGQNTFLSKISIEKTL